MTAVSANETTADNDIEVEYYRAVAEMRRLRDALDHAGDDDYEDIDREYRAQAKLVREINATR